MYTILVMGNCPVELKNSLEQKIRTLDNVGGIQFQQEGQDRFHLVRRGLYDGNIILVFPEDGVPGLATESAGLKKIPVIVCNMDGKLNSWLDYLKSEDAKIEKHFKINCFNPGNSQLNPVLELDGRENVEVISEKILATITDLLPAYPKLITRADDSIPEPSEFQELVAALRSQNENMLFLPKLQKQKPTLSVICAAFPLRSIAFNGYELGEVIGKSGFDFINGAGGKKLDKSDQDQPLMYQTAHGAKIAGAKNTGVITPFECIKYEKNNDLSLYDNMIFVNNLSERINAFSMADVVIVGPGGTGTMDEYWALSCENIIILNIDGFYDNLKNYLVELRPNRSVQFVDSIDQLEVALRELHHTLENQYNQTENKGPSIVNLSYFNRRGVMQEDPQSNNELNSRRVLN